MHGSVSLPPVEQLALELVQLIAIRPRLKVQFTSSEDLQKTNNTYRDHMHQEYLLREEIIRRVGPDNADDYVNRAMSIMALLST